FRREQLIKLVDKALERRDLIEQNKALKKQLEDIRAKGQMIGSSPAYRRMLSLVEQIADSSATILIQGQNRPGKDLLPPPTDHRALRPAGRSLRGRQLRGAARDLARVRAVRLREGRVHRRRRSKGRPLRAGQRRHALPRRGRRPLAGYPAQDPASPPGGRVRA